MRAFEFVMKEDWSRKPKLPLKQLKKDLEAEEARQASIDKRLEFLPIMYAREDPIERKMREIELRKQWLELRQLEAEIAQTEAETENERAELEGDGMEAVRRLSRSEMRRSRG